MSGTIKAVMFDTEAAVDERAAADVVAAVKDLEKRLVGKEQAIRIDKYTVRRGVVTGIKFACWKTVGTKTKRALLEVAMQCGSTGYTAKSQVVWLQIDDTKYSLTLVKKKIKAGTQFDMGLNWKEIDADKYDHELAEPAENGTGSKQWDWEENIWQTEMAN